MMFFIILLYTFLWVPFAAFDGHKSVNGNPTKHRNGALVHPQHRPPLLDNLSNFLQVHNTNILRFPLQKYYFFFNQQNKIAINCDFSRQNTRLMTYLILRLSHKRYHVGLYIHFFISTTNCFSISP